MAGINNLRPVQSVEEAREKGRAGGIASGAARRAKRDARETAKMVLDMTPEINPKMLDTMKRMGLKGKARPDMRMICTMAMMQKAMKGDKAAYEFVLNVAGETSRSELDDIRVFAERRAAWLDEAEEKQRELFRIKQKLDSMTPEQRAKYDELRSLLEVEEPDDDGLMTALKTSCEEIGDLTEDVPEDA